MYLPPYSPELNPIEQFWASVKGKMTKEETLSSRIGDALSLYGRASNAKLNCHKTLAISLSGQEQLEWRTMLNANRILQWHDNKETTAAIYLGYPLTSSTQQMSKYLDNTKNFPSVKFQDYRKPRNEGGIAILDPAMQYSALQLRWLIPMLQSTHTTSIQESFVASLMRYYLCVLTLSPSVILPLLFSEKRSPDIKKIGCFQSMLRTLDHMDYGINWTDLNTSTAEEIPLCRLCPALLTNDHTYKSPYWKSLLVKDVYGFNAIDRKLIPRGSFISSQQRNRAIKYLDLLRTGQIAEEDFFVALKNSPNCALGGFISSFGFQRPAPQFASLFSSPLPDGTPVEKLSTKWFRNLDMLPLDSLPPTYPRASKSSWNKFWHVLIPHPARTILWRLYHSKLPTRSRSHKIMPRYITDEGCVMCGAQRFLNQPSLLSFDQINRPLQTTAKTLSHWKLDTFHVIACGVLSLWRLHWKYIFEDTPFWPNEATARATALLRRIRSENLRRQET
ncbi:hypothetical protein G6F26_001914 [Rhizopus arrhizus]|nr:hypothetical protein G6F17_003324 [Rhizopus arrhizus]KAG0877256.1 hypothetical protein G6F16_001749 [Rhizopus arrhizus]KAG0896476.1 hypothetical protein G6F34_007320 [Rhizopus arrhizus]KAG1029233.1 hypothetical protein G6F26_001914 [Rhizopus arrhizus]KAG1099957.1 hypothetical protein G6F39_004322 [Rhizopus arrhizus]